MKLIYKHEKIKTYTINRSKNNKWIIKTYEKKIIHYKCICMKNNNGL